MRPSRRARSFRARSAVPINFSQIATIFISNIPLLQVPTARTNRAQHYREHKLAHESFQFCGCDLKLIYVCLVVFYKLHIFPAEFQVIYHILQQ